MENNKGEAACSIGQENKDIQRRLIPWFLAPCLRFVWSDVCAFQYAKM